MVFTNIIKKMLKKILILNILLVVLIFAFNKTVFSNEKINEKKIETRMEYSEDYLNWLKLSDEEKSNTIMIPNPLVIHNSSYSSNNLFAELKIGANVSSSQYSLKNDIPANMKIRDQGTNGLCWAFASLASLESNLAYSDYLSGREAKEYDFSEKHMGYAMSREFKDGQINNKGLARQANGNALISASSAYLTNGMGAVEESEMPYDNNFPTIDLSEITNKKVVTEVSDIVAYPEPTTDDEKNVIKDKIKEHITKYGGLQTCIYGAGLFSEYYNNNTGAIYCDDATKCKIDHEVLIVGWNDDYDKNNFSEKHKPTSNGAWIIKNSWGEKIEYSLSEMKQVIFEQFPDDCKRQGWDTYDKIPDNTAKQTFQENGYTIEGDKATLKIGDNGFMYISYEDVNVYSELRGVQKASENISYENIYQYDYTGPDVTMTSNTNKYLLANVFEKKNSGKEYLKQVAIYATEPYKCKVYVCPDQSYFDENGSANMQANLVQAQLVDGETETIEAGYHTIEFMNPILLNSDKFTVIIEIEGFNPNSISISVEAPLPGETSMTKNVEVENQKCFLNTYGSLNLNYWADMSKFVESGQGALLDCDSTIKAFTVTSITQNILTGIEIEVPPYKTTYTQGTNFDKTGMKVNAIYEDGSKNEITNYTIQNGENLQLNQKEVIISYMGFSAKQEIRVIRDNLIDPTPSEDTKDPISSIFDKAKVKQINKKSADTVEVTVNDIVKSKLNDRFEYYYYLSSKAVEQNITNWVKINEEQSINSDEIKFNISLNDITNLQELLYANNVYLYIKEIAYRGSKNKEVISKGISLNSNDSNGNNQNGANNNNGGNNSNGGNNNGSGNNNGGNGSTSGGNNGGTSQQVVQGQKDVLKDDTVSGGILPKTGYKITIIVTAFIISIVGICIYIKYKKIEY